jgi:O-antigen/teichoic acid export membrane protein
MRKKELNIYLKAGIWVMICEILIRSVSFLSTPIFTRILPMSVYGDVRTYESWLSILAPVLSAGLSLNIEAAEYRFKEHFERYVSSVMFLVLLINAGILVVTVFAQQWLCKLLDFTPIMLFIAVLYCCFYSIIVCAIRVQRMRLKYKVTVLLSFLLIVPSLLLSIACCYFAPDVSDRVLLNIRVVSFYIPIIIVGMAVAATFWMKEKSLVNQEYWKEALRASLPLIMYQISLQVLTQSDRIMIKNMVSSDAAALFSIATTLIYIIETIHKGFTSAWIPWLYNQLANGEYKKVNKAVYLVIAGFFGISFATLLFGKEIIFIFGGKSYEEAQWLLGPMLAGVIFQVLMLKIADVEKFYKKENYVGIISFVIVIINLASNYIGILLGGYQIAAYTTMLSYVVAVIIHSVLVKRKIPELKDLSYGGFILVSAVASIVLIVGMFVYKINLLLRIGAFLVLGALVMIMGYKMYKKMKMGTGKLEKD